MALLAFDSGLQVYLFRKYIALSNRQKIHLHEFKAWRGQSCSLLDAHARGARQRTYDSQESGSSEVATHRHADGRRAAA
jgi:hypothetical protein